MTAFRIAVRYLLARKSHTAVNVISYISMAGIAVAAMAMVCILSVFNGFSDLAAARLSKVDPDLKVTSNEGKIIQNADSLAELIREIPGVRKVLPAFQGEALALYRDMQIPLNIRGVMKGYGEVSAITSLMIDGYMNPDTYDLKGAAVSVGVANFLGARPLLAEPLVLCVPRRIGHVNPALPLSAFVSDTVYVTGVYRTDQSEYDGSTIFLPLDVARNLFDYTTETTSIDIAIKKGADIRQVERAIGELLGPQYLVADRLRQQSHSFRMISIEKWITFLILVFVLIMASFNILSSLSMLLIEKRESLDILASLGAPMPMLRRIFLYQGILVGAAGGVIGVVIGVVLSLIQQHYGIITLGGDHSQMSIVTYPCLLQVWDVLITLGVVLVIGLCAGLIAARSVRLSSE